VEEREVKGAEKP